MGLLSANVRAQTSELSDSVLVEVSFDRAPVVGATTPCVKLTAAQALRSAHVKVEGGSQPRSFSLKLKRGQAKQLCWREAPGHYNYRMSVQSGRDNQQFEFSVDHWPPIEVSVNRKQPVLAQRRLVFTSNHPLASAELVVKGDRDQVLHTASQTFTESEPGAEVALSWPKLKATPAALELRVTSVDGHWTAQKVEFWSVEIAHREVEFETNAWVVRASESPKLDEAIAKIINAARLKGSELPVKLYVAGFTDTVGDKAHNRQLSLRRAEAIAHYFVSHGVHLPIYVRGFGEEALAVATRDQQPEARNRRARYILAAEPPAFAPHVTWGKWTALARDK